MGTLVIDVIEDVAGLEPLRTEWEALLPESANDEPVLTPGWLLNWWHTFGGLAGRSLRVATFRDGKRLVGLAPLLLRKVPATLLPPVRRLELLGAGEDEGDEICSEFIGFVVQRGHEAGLAEGFSEALDAGRFGAWDELRLEALNGDTALPVYLADALRRRGFDVRAELTNGAPFVPLPSTFAAYLEGLSSSSRSLVRRSLRDFEAWTGAPVTLRRATDASSLAVGKRLLRALHEQRWGADGQDGVFRSERFRAFHERAMDDLFARGALDLLWLEAHGEPVAASYNFLWRDRVYYYQGGRRPDLPPKIRPGLVIHAATIRDAIAAGRREYHFLGGMARYKTQLAPAVRPLMAITAARVSLSQMTRQISGLLVEDGRALLRRQRLSS